MRNTHHSTISMSYYMGTANLIKILEFMSDYKRMNESFSYQWFPFYKHLWWGMEKRRIPREKGKGRGKKRRGKESEINCIFFNIESKSK